jgi:hypothetical protein
MIQTARLQYALAAWVIGLALVAAPIGAAAQGRPEKGHLNFLLAFGAQAATASGAKLMPVENETRLRSGDRLKLFVEPRAEMFFYLVHQNPQGELALLLPADPRSARLVSGKGVFVPADDHWFELDAQTGQEKFLVLASAERLDRLEELLAQYGALTETAARAAAADGIMNEIKKLRQQAKPLSAPAEKPVRIGGSVRAPSGKSPAAIPDITPFASEITAPGFYSRTFSIEHR